MFWCSQTKLCGKNCGRPVRTSNLRKEYDCIVRHTIPVVKDADKNFAGSDSGVQPMPFKVCTFFRTEKCEMLCQPSLQICSSCLAANKYSV